MIDSYEGVRSDSGFSREMKTPTMPEDPDQQTMNSDELQITLEDLLPLQVTPEPGGDYRCPVSTPALSMSTEAKMQRFNSVNEAGHSTTRGFGRRLTHCHRATEVSYPHYLYRKQHPTKTNLDYYYRYGRSSTMPISNPGDQTLDEKVSPIWLKTMTSQPFDELYDQYKRKSEVKSTFENRQTCYRTPGELALLKGWEKNGGKSSLDSGEDKSLTVTSTDACVHKAFPPGRKRLVRSLTQGEENFKLNRHREMQHSARVSRWNGDFARMPNYTPSITLNSSDNGRKGSVSSTEISGTSWKSNLDRKRTNYLNFRTRLKSPEKHHGQVSKKNGSANLPDIHIKSTQVKEANLTTDALERGSRMYQRSIEKNNTTNYAASVELSSSVLRSSQVPDKFVNENKYGLSKSAPCIICIAMDTATDIDRRM